MTTVDGRVARGERNREAIADALLACYDDGILRPSVPEVAARAGVSVRSVHNHFADVEALRADVARRQWERAALLSVHDSPTIARRLASFERILHRQLEHAFPELSSDTLDALEVVTSWDAWNRLRVAQGCSVAKAKRIITDLVHAITERNES